MRRYFFDLRDDDLLTLDEEGMHLATVEAVQLEAARSLADMAKELVPQMSRSGGHRIAIEVRDNDGPVMKVLFALAAERHRN